jgi:hypothetical protein
MLLIVVGLVAITLMAVGALTLLVVQAGLALARRLDTKQ